MFQPSSSQIPLIMHNHPSSWTTLNNAYNQVLQRPTEDHDPFLLPSQPQTTYPSSHGGLLKRVYKGTTTSPSIQSVGLDPFGMHVETSKMNTQKNIIETKARATSKSHSEAERRRRQRINNHLTNLRSLLPNTTKTDKASLLAEVIQHVRELKSQTSVIAKQYVVPTEIDELTIDNTSTDEFQGQIVIKASLCCEDRWDLLPDLIKTLKLLQLRTLKAEITTLGGRVKNVLFVTRDHVGDDHSNNDWISAIEEALQAFVERTDENMNDSSFTRIKRQRTNNNGIF